MLSQELRDKLIEQMRQNPQEAVKTIEAEPQILELLLKSDQEAEREKVDKAKYISMTMDMQRQLQESAKKLNTTQGALIGAGLLLLLSLLDRK